MRTRRRAALTCCLIGVLTCACARQDRQIHQHQQALESCAATVNAIADAWLEGQVSGTYARTALDRTLRLAEQERTALTRPHLLIDERGASLADAADHLERVIAAMLYGVRGADADAVRHALATLPIHDQRGSR